MKTVIHLGRSRIMDTSITATRNPYKFTVRPRDERFQSKALLKYINHRKKLRLIVRLDPSLPIVWV